MEKRFLSLVFIVIFGVSFIVSAAVNRKFEFEFSNITQPSDGVIVTVTPLVPESQPYANIFHKGQTIHLKAGECKLEDVEFYKGSATVLAMLKSNDNFGYILIGLKLDSNNNMDIAFSDVVNLSAAFAPSCGFNWKMASETGEIGFGLQNLNI